MGCSNSKELDVMRRASMSAEAAFRESAAPAVKDDKLPLKPLVAAATAAASAVKPALPAYAPAPLPLNEADRLSTLCALKFLDTAPDPRFDEITKLMTKLFKVSMSLVSMIDEYRCWLKSKEGMPVCEAPRDVGICAWTLVPPHPELLVIEDTLKDSRFHNCPLVVHPPHIRFYCGAPLVASNGHRLGNLYAQTCMLHFCHWVIMDDKPGKLDAERAMLLANFAEIVVRQIEKTTMATQQSYLVKKNAQSLLRALDCFTEGLILVNLSTPGWDVVYVNDAWTKLTDVPEQTVVNAALWSHCELVGRSQPLLNSIQNAICKRTEFSVVISVHGKKFAVTFRPAHQGQLNKNAPMLGIPASLPWDHTQTSNQPFFFGTVRPATANDDPSRLSTHITLKGSSLPRPKEDPFHDVVLGPVLGRGSFGRVYRGVWRGTPVAVKILQYSMGQAKAQAACKSLEEIAGTKVVHPNICPCYRISSRVVSGDAEVTPIQTASTEEDSMWRAVSAKSRAACISGDSLQSDMDSAAGGRGVLPMRDAMPLGAEALLNSRSLSGAASVGAVSVVDSVAEGASRTRPADGGKDGQAGHAALMKAALINNMLHGDGTTQTMQDKGPFATAGAFQLRGHVGDGRTDAQGGTCSAVSMHEHVGLGRGSPPLEEVVEGDAEGVEAFAEEDGGGVDSDFCSVCSDLSRDSLVEGAQQEPRDSGTHSAGQGNADSTSREGSSQAASDDESRGSHGAAGPDRAPKPADNAAALSSAALDNKQVVQESWMLMELCDMGTLMNACERGQFMRIADDNSGFVPNMLAICRTLQEICSALDYLHKLDILHADLNGNNVLLVSCNRDERGFTAKVSDFGLSRIVSDVVQTATTGTTTHMPPELLADGDLSKGTDVYALGVIMWELYHGKRAYAGMHPMQVLFQVAVKKLPLDFPTDKDSDYVALARRCLLPDRQERPSTQDMLDTISKLIQTYS